MAPVPPRAYSRTGSRTGWCYAKIRDAMGGQMRFIVCGGARLSPPFGYFYTGLGVSVLEGYGLTESSAPTTCNPQYTSRIGTVGMPLPGCSVRIVNDGEVLLKGPNIFAGYRHAQVVSPTRC